MRGYDYYIQKSDLPDAILFNGHIYSIIELTALNHQDYEEVMSLGEVLDEKEVCHGATNTKGDV